MYQKPVIVVSIDGQNVNLGTEGDCKLIIKKKTKDNPEVKAEITGATQAQAKVFFERNSKILKEGTQKELEDAKCFVFGSNTAGTGNGNK